MDILDLEQLGIAALVWASLWIYLGIKYPGHRRLWAWADAAALLVGSATAVFLAYSIIEDLEASRAAAAQSVERLLRWELHHANGQLQDKSCRALASADARRESAIAPVCKFSADLQRELAAPRFNHISSARLHGEAEKLCVKPCNNEMTTVIDKLKNYTNYYSEHRDQFEGFASRPEKLRWKVYFITAFIFAFGPRCGRSAAELAREGCFKRFARLKIFSRSGSA